MGSGLHVSVSQIKAYLRCPRQYQLHYVMGIEPSFIPIPLAFGGAFHSALAFLYGLLAATAKLPTVQEVVGVFKDAWGNASGGTIPLLADDDDENHHEEKGQSMLRLLHEQIASKPPEVVAVERGFSVDLADPDTGEVLEEKLVGGIDLIVKEGNKNIIVEHKTSARRYSKDQLDYDLQPTAYKLAAKQLGLGDVGLKMQVVTKTKNPVVQIEDITRSPEDEVDFMRIAVGVLRAVDAGAFFPVRSWACKGCQWSKACSTRGGPA